MVCEGNSCVKAAIKKIWEDDWKILWDQAGQCLESASPDASPTTVVNMDLFSSDEHYWELFQRGPKAALTANLFFVSMHAVVTEVGAYEFSDSNIVSSWNLRSCYFLLSPNSSHSKTFVAPLPSPSQGPLREKLRLIEKSTDSRVSESVTTQSTMYILTV